MSLNHSLFVDTSLKRHTAQLQALFGPVSPDYAHSDVITIRVSEKYVARAIYLGNGLHGRLTSLTGQTLSKDPAEETYSTRWRTYELSLRADILRAQTVNTTRPGVGIDAEHLELIPVGTFSVYNQGKGCIIVGMVDDAAEKH